MVNYEDKLCEYDVKLEEYGGVFIKVEDVLNVYDVKLEEYGGVLVGIVKEWDWYIDWVVDLVIL